MKITILDLIANGTDLYDVIVRRFNEGAGVAENVYAGNARLAPLELLECDIKYIYAENNTVVFEI